jgi:alkanesulfonate monooxygenase SsuD/methylene tetrahydromethanopterin reductase-like flavin-dependent oxidoreductase (luciferase family)
MDYRDPVLHGEGGMRFIWFNLMPWPHLPEDFREKYRSVWVDIPSSLYDPVRGHEVYNDYLDQLEFAETVGFDGLGVNEHHANAYGLMPSPTLMAAALARRTSRAALVVLGSSIALYEPPIRVAEEFAMLDVLSGGRLVAGFPVGTSMDTNYAYGRVPATLRERYAEAHDLIRRAWAADEPFIFNGRFNQLRYANCWPKPVQKPRPPIFIPGGGSVETYDFCIENDYNYSYLSFFGYLRAQKLMANYWQRVAEMGADDSPYRATFAQCICVAETDAEAERLYGPHVSYFFNRCLHVYPGFADAPGYRTIKTIQAGFLNQLSRANLGHAATLSWQELIELGYIVAGSPETVRQRMEELIKGLRVGNIICLFQMGDMPTEKTCHSSELFAHKVMPHLKRIWKDYDGDERFWIRPLPQRVVPGRATAEIRP